VALCCEEEATEHGADFIVDGGALNGHRIVTRSPLAGTAGLRFGV
jgi:hypothetical protein